MSGEIFTQMAELADFENAAKRNPLLCYLCNEQFEDPRILPCFHSFCSKCLRGRVSECKIVCPLCGTTTQLKEDQALPNSDSLLKFLIESSSEEKAVCANCDTNHGHMFFCNTCAQPLCGQCREDTHKAKMFSSHEIVLMSKRTKDIHKLCKLHDEPYIMFSTEKKAMLCINCFRDMKIESRSHCVDLETAYKQGCKKLDQAVLALHDLQNSVRDGILLLRVLLDEVRCNAFSEKQAIQTLFVNIQDKVLEKKTELEQEVEKQYKAKESLFKGHLVSLTTLLPTIHVNLVTSAAFTGSANKHEFLDLAYSLMNRLTSIVQHHHHLHPNQSSQINSDYKAKVAKCLEPLLFPYYNKGDNCCSSLPLSRPTTSQNGTMPNIRLELPTTTPSTTNAASGSVTVVSYGPNGGRRGNNNASKVKFIDAKGVFAEHCVEFDNNHRDLLQKLEKLKSRVQELHRDLTLRRILAKNCKVSEFKVYVSEVDEQLAKHLDFLDQKRVTLEKHWEESLQRIGNEQELYQAQMSDVIRLKQECQHLKTIVTQLCPFVESISKVTERIVPKLGDCSTTSSRADQIHALFEQISTMTPDSQQRVDAIRSAEEEREILSANRTNPLDDELIKTKGLLRTPSVRRESGTKRDSVDHPKEGIALDSVRDSGPLMSVSWEEAKLSGQLALKGLLTDGARIKSCNSPLNTHSEVSSTLNNSTTNQQDIFNKSEGNAPITEGRNLMKSSSIQELSKKASITDTSGNITTIGECVSSWSTQANGPDGCIMSELTITNKQNANSRSLGSTIPIGATETCVQSNGHDTTENELCNENGTHILSIKQNQKISPTLTGQIKESSAKDIDKIDCETSPKTKEHRLSCELFNGHHKTDLCNGHGCGDAPDVPRIFGKGSLMSKDPSRKTNSDAKSVKIADRTSTFVKMTSNHDATVKKSKEDQVDCLPVTMTTFEGAMSDMVKDCIPGQSVSLPISGNSSH